MTTIYESYISYHNKYASQYTDNKFIVLMQVGDFYECYGTDTLGPDLKTISSVTGMTRGIKNKKQDGPISLKKPYFMGFPMNSVDKYLKRLIDQSYTVIVVDQVKKYERIGVRDGSQEERKVTQILTKGTYIETIDTKTSNYIVCIYISHDEQKNSHPLYSVGLSAVDLSTSHTFVHEAYSTKYDPKLALDEAGRFIKNLSPEEILIYYDDNRKISKHEKKEKEFLIDYLDIREKSCRFSGTVDAKYHRLNVQNEILGLIYKDSQNILSPIENLDLESNIFTIISLILMIDFIYLNNKSLLSGLHRPKQFFDSQHLVLGNNAIRQLDIVDSMDKDTDDAKYKSIFQVVNKTSTALGERYLATMLKSPMCDANQINEVYAMTEEMICIWKDTEKYLEDVKDIERLQRKMELGMMRPYELVVLIESYHSIIKLIEFLKKNKKTNKLLANLTPNKVQQTSIKKFIEYYEEKFCSDELSKYTTMEIKTNIFNEGVYPDIDQMIGKIENSEKILESLRVVFDNIIRSKLPKSKSSDNLVKMGKNTKEGYFLLVSKPRCAILRKELEIQKQISVGSNLINISELKYVELESNIKIKFGSISSTSDTIKVDMERIEFLNKKYFLEQLTLIHSQYNDMFDICGKFITKIDYLKSGAKLATTYKYVRPIIDTQEYGYVESDNLRHPLIERNISSEYVPHNVRIGKDDLKGMLIYGVNGAGKSVLMKAIGISVIMAQAGLYVPATKYKFSPYQSIIARITGSDNIFRGLSSFTLEMVELNAILKRNGSRTLVIGDEVCRGTEHISGTSIVAASILQLTESKSSFIFATHLHEIMELDEIKSLTNVKPYNIYIKYDSKTDSFICDRILKEGVGETVYGLEIARHIISDTKFIDCANRIQTKLLKKYQSIISGKTSRYNSNILVYSCNICGKEDNTASHISPLETHHINFQKDCVDGFIKDKPHIRANHQSNLIILCDDCHNKVHRNELKIIGWKATTRGNRVLEKLNN